MTAPDDLGAEPVADLDTDQPDDATDSDAGAEADAGVPEEDAGDDDLGDDVEPGLEDYLAAVRTLELEDDPGADDDGDEPEPASQREGRYRTRLREAEGRLQTQEQVITALQEQVMARDRADAERLAGARLADGADIWAAGVQLDDLLGDDGRIDPKRVDAAVREVLGRRPHWGVPRSRRYSMPVSGASNTPEEPRNSSFAAAFAPPRRD